MFFVFFFFSLLFCLVLWDELCTSAIPSIGPSLQKPFQEYLEAQRIKLHHRPDSAVPQGENWLSWIFEKLVIVMVCYFILSIINSMAQSYAKRQQQKMYSEEKTK